MARKIRAKLKTGLRELKYFKAEQIHTVFLCVRNVAGEIKLGTKGLRFFINPEHNEPHNEPHAHVRTADGQRESVHRISDGRRLERGGSGLPRQLCARAHAAVAANSAQLMDEWLRQSDGIVRMTDGAFGPAVVVDRGLAACSPEEPADMERAWGRD